MADSLAPRAARWPWVAAAVAVLLADIVLFGSQRGECIDYAPGSGAESVCTSGPSVGWPAAWVLVVISVLLIAYVVTRLIRSRP